MEFPTACLANLLKTYEQARFHPENINNSEKSGGIGPSTPPASKMIGSLNITKRLHKHIARRSKVNAETSIQLLTSAVDLQAYVHIYSQL